MELYTLCQFWSEHRGLNFESNEPIVISMYKAPSFDWTCTWTWTCAVTHNSICVCNNIEMTEKWASGRLPEIKNNRKIEITSVESCRGHLREVLIIVV